MVDEISEKVRFSKRRIDVMLKSLEKIASGQYSLQLPLSENNDELDGISFAVNTICDEIMYREKLKADALKEAWRRAKKLNEEKSLFIANISHEIRNPMTVVLGFINLIRSRDLDSKSVDNYLAKINFSANHVLMAVNDLIDMQKMETGNLKFNFTKVDLGALVVDVCSNYKNLADDKNMNLDVQGIHNLVSGELVSDSYRVRQVVGNLVHNAIKYAPLKNTITLTLSETFDCNGYRQIVIGVLDEGPGIAKDERDAVFKPFNNISKVPGSGTGIGLSYCLNVSQCLGGSLTIEDSPNGKGAFFVFKIPDLQLSCKELIKTPNGRDADENAIPINNVLIVDNDMVSLRLLQSHLERITSNIETLISAEAAAEHLAENSGVDLVFIDIAIAEKFGCNLIETIRVFCPRAKIIGLVPMTMAKSSEYLNIFYDGSLQKPLHSNQVEGLLSDLRKSKI